MKVKLTVVQGKPEGKEFVLPVNPFVIGRGEKCHLRPNNDAVGEKHCAIIAKADGVVVRDLGSPTGTLINGQKIEADTAVKTGDLLQIGPLVFALTLLAAEKKKAAAAAKPSARKAAQASASSSAPAQEEDDDVDVTDWLGGPDDEASSPAEPEPAPAAATRQPVFDDMDLPPDPSLADPEEGAAGEEQSEEAAKKPTEAEAASTARAASDLLRKYFTRPRE